MIFRQLFDRETCTYTYLLGCPRTREAVIIDPVRELVERDARTVRELGLHLVYALDTHVHADHVTGAAELRRRTGCKTVLSRAANAENVDIEVAHGDAIRFGIHALEVRATPGHTDTCVSYLTADLSRVFTGDALFVRGCGRTDFQSGDARTLYRSVYDQLLSLPDDTEIRPGHDYQGRTVTTVREERLYNPRLGHGRDEEAFVAIMDGLGLAYPARIDVAVPANLRNGHVDGDASAATHAPWAPVTRTASGAPRVAAAWVAQHGARAQIVDVREPEEFRGPLGHVPGSALVPMDLLESTALDWDRQGAIVVVCRSGGRSDRAAHILEELGFQHVASMTGGMAAWNEAGLPVERPTHRQG